MKYKLKRGVVYQGVMYRAGEFIDADALNYSFTWLTERGFIDATAPDLPAADDNLVANALPPLDEPKHRGKKNGDA